MRPFFFFPFKIGSLYLAYSGIGVVLAWLCFPHNDGVLFIEVLFSEFS